jgi:hypothetical protein
MLLETIKRHDSQGVVKLVCLESLSAAGKPIPPQIHSVPALMLMPNKEMLFGKHVFDYLLLPGRGKLLVGGGPTQKPVVAEAAVGGDPAPFAFGEGASDAFTTINDMGAGAADGQGHGFGDRTYSWSTINDNVAASQEAAPSNMALQEETRARKEDINIDAVRMQRELDLNSIFGDSVAPRLMRP